ncbi:flavodoxin family protein [Leucobacter sp. W1153]|uniref:flavodoxin family protein n=1 Tax=unclassified Leucobacter TaxID=2621730 RepID=UPI003F2C9BF3
MRAIVIFESLWGNTEQIAREIASGMSEARSDLQVEIHPAAAEALPVDGIELIVVGGPTHAFSMSSSSTRQGATQQGATDIPDAGIREWIEAQPSPAKPVWAATFDTRVVSPRLPGSAAKKALKRIVRLGFQPAAEPETFGVHGYSGPIADGELERAREWGASLAVALKRD